MSMLGGARQISTVNENEGPQSGVLVCSLMPSDVPSSTELTHHETVPGEAKDELQAS